MVNDVVVVGGGSAGFMAALALKRKAPQLRVVVIRSKSIGIIGVGEGSAVPFARFLHDFLGIGVANLVRAVRPVWKLGTCFLWGPRPRFMFPFGTTLNAHVGGLPKANGYYCAADLECASAGSAFMAHDRVFDRAPDGRPVLHNDFAYHVENESFAAYLETLAAAAGVQIRDDTIRAVRQNEQGVSALDLESGATVTADLYVDCSGFVSLLLGKAFGEPFVRYDSTLFCDRAVVGGWPRAGEPIRPYTVAESMDAGWCWRIDHPDRINRGYVYCSGFLSDEQAERELREKNPKVGATRVVKFTSGRYRRSWVKNVVALGNASGFVEPLEATALAIIGTRCIVLGELLCDADLNPAPAHAEMFNRVTARVWDSTRRFLALHYKFNTRLDTPFWRHCRANTDLAGYEPVVEFYQQAGPSPYGLAGLVDEMDVFGIEGCLMTLLGQCVPYRCTYVPTEREVAVWNAAREQNRLRAVRAIRTEELLARLNGPAQAPAQAPAPACTA